MKMLTTHDLAERWQRSPAWITAEAKAGNIPGAFKLGHLWRFDPQDIAAHEADSKRDSDLALTAGSRARRRAA